MLSRHDLENERNSQAEDCAEGWFQGQATFVERSAELPRRRHEAALPDDLECDAWAVGAADCCSSEGAPHDGGSDSWQISSMG